MVGSSISQSGFANLTGKKQIFCKTFIAKLNAYQKVTPGQK